MRRWPARSAAAVAVLLLPLPAQAEAALADMYLLLPKMLLALVYIGLLRYGWLLAVVVALGWLVHVSARYYRAHHDGADNDELMQLLRVLPSHRALTGIGIAALACWLLARVLISAEQLDSLEALMAQEVKPAQQVPPPATPLPLTNPFGGQWPDRMGYLAGAPVLARNGRTTLLVSNESSGQPVYVKLCRYGEQACRGLRHAYIDAGWYFSFEQVTPGDYELRYQRTYPAGLAARSGRITIANGRVGQEVRVQIPAAPAATAEAGTAFTRIDTAAF